MQKTSILKLKGTKKKILKYKLMASSTKSCTSNDPAISMKCPKIALITQFSPDHSTGGTNYTLMHNCLLSLYACSSTILPSSPQGTNQAREM